MGPIFMQNFRKFRDTGLWGVYLVADGHSLDDTTGIMKSVQHEWKV